MITDAIMGWIASALVTLLNALPDFPDGVEDTLLSAPGHVHDLVLSANEWSYIVPWDAAALGVGVAIVGMLVGAAVKIVRIVASYLTLGGGM